MSLEEYENVIVKLINDLELMYQKDITFRNIFEDYTKLKNTLAELNSLIEMDNVKDVIVKQVRMLVVDAYRNLKNGTDRSTRFDNHMLHTVFYGNPGVGKSKTAKYLARCWEALGLLKSYSEESINPKDLLNKVNSNRALFLELYESYKIGSNDKSLNKVTNFWKLHCEKWEIIKSGLKEIGSDISNCVLNKLELTPREEPMIVICGRENFVAEYSGQTSIKTANFLKQNLGKCIIIEEAYLLCHSETDTYGMEAITVLNRFMDEYPESLIVIFTGYEDLLKNTIFKFQPGLKRRCQWIFNLKSYSPSGLALIFTKQLNDLNWEVSEDLNLVKFFSDNFEYFPHFGGDTEKLSLQCKMIYSMDSFENLLKNIIDEGSPYKEKRLITEKILIKGFEEFKKHNLS
jgi:DNA polymerase III delta prime subunit